MVRTGSMRKGKYDKQIAIQGSTRTADGQGGATVVWTNVATEWARIHELSNTRALIDDGIKFTKAVEMEMRERGDTYTFGGEYRISWDSLYWTVYNAVTNDNITVITAYTNV